jgi:hypothetical protein
MKRILQHFIDFCTKNQIPVVVAAGNYPSTADVKENLPHVLSKPDDSMIIVGGVDEKGLVISEMIADSTGLVHVYAPGKNIKAPTDATNWETSSGTSQSAAITVCFAFHHLQDMFANKCTVWPDRLLQRSTELADL